MSARYCCSRTPPGSTVGCGKPIAFLLNDQFRCVSLDLRGHGLSELPPEAGLAWSGMADDVLAALDSDHLRAGPLHGVGHSMGGAALVLAAGRDQTPFARCGLRAGHRPSDGQALFGGETPCPRQQPGAATASTRATRRTRTIDRSLRSTSCTPMPYGLRRRRLRSDPRRRRHLTVSALHRSRGVPSSRDQRCMGERRLAREPVAVVVGRPEAMGPGHSHRRPQLRSLGEH